MHILTTLFISQFTGEDKDVLHIFVVYPPTTSSTSSTLKYWPLGPVPALVVNTNDTHIHTPSGVLKYSMPRPTMATCLMIEKNLKRITRYGVRGVGDDVMAVWGQGNQRLT